MPLARPRGAATDGSAFEGDEHRTLLRRPRPPTSRHHAGPSDRHDGYERHAAWVGAETTVPVVGMQLPEKDGDAPDGRHHCCHERWPPLQEGKEQRNPIASSPTLAPVAPCGRSHCPSDPTENDEAGRGTGDSRQNHDGLTSHHWRATPGNYGALAVVVLFPGCRVPWEASRFSNERRRHTSQTSWRRFLCSRTEVPVFAPRRDRSSRWRPGRSPNRSSSTERRPPWVPRQPAPGFVPAGSRRSWPARRRALTRPQRRRRPRGARPTALAVSAVLQPAVRRTPWRSPHRAAARGGRSGRGSR